MDNNFGGLEKAFDVNDPKPKKATPIKSTEDQVNDDHEYARANLYSLIEKGQEACLLYTSPSPRDLSTSRMPSSA